MVLSFIRRWLIGLLTRSQRWLRNYLRPNRNRCGDFTLVDPLYRFPPEARIDFVGRATLTRPSTPDPNSSSGSVSCLNSQSTPLLAILPPEIRCQIWEEVLGGHAFHLHIETISNMIMDRRQFFGWRCNSPNPSTCDSRGPPILCRLAPLSGEELMERKHMLALLLTCRRM
jgi:hypothetical protein